MSSGDVFKLIRTLPMKANTLSGSSTKKVMHVDYKILRLLFTQCKLSLLVVCTETFSFHHASPTFFLPLLF
jgi:hypothetical protein